MPEEINLPNGGTAYVLTDDDIKVMVKTFCETRGLLEALFIDEEDMKTKSRISKLKSKKTTKKQKHGRTTTKRR
jgi:hypothetical protein